MRFQRGRRVGRLSMRDRLAQINAADRFYATMAGKEPQAQSVILPKRVRAVSSADSSSIDIDAVHRKQPVPLEKEILKACLAALKLHPRVAFAGRFNRGVMQSSYGGRDSYTSFNSVPGFPDIHGMLKGGAAFYIEVKRPITGRLDDKQSNFLASIKACGGIAGVATSVAEALALISPHP